MSIINILKEDYLYENDGSEQSPFISGEVVEEPNVEDGREQLDKAFIIKLSNYLDKLFPQFGTFDDQIGNEIRNYMDGTDNNEVMNTKRRIHKVVIDEKNKFLTRLQRRLSRVRVLKRKV